MTTSIRVYETPEGVFERKMEWFAKRGNTTAVHQQLRQVTPEGKTGRWQPLTFFECLASGFVATVEGRGGAVSVLRTSAIRSVTCK